VATVEFKAAVVIACSPDRAFEFFADHRHVAQVVDGVSRWEPIGTKTRGTGARYNVEMVALGLPLKSVLRLNRWKPGKEIGWVSESGLIRQEGGFTFTPVEGGVRVELRIVYEPPGGAVGGALARRMDWTVKRRLDAALAAIKKTLEGGGAASKVGS
jgi:uncharacterized membrane protein